MTTIPIPSKENTVTTPIINLDALKALDQAATPGPWTAGGPYVRRHEVVVAQRLPFVELTSDTEGEANATLIAAARNALPELVAEVERLRAELAETKVTLHLTEQERLNYRENIEWLRRELEISRNALATARDRIADLEKTCWDVTAGRDDLLKAIRLAISDPGAFLKREKVDGHHGDEYESISNWCARAVIQALGDRGLL